MSINRSLFLLMLACLLGVLCGCASTPPKGTPSQDATRSGTDEYDGWLFNSLTGRHKAKTEQTTPPANPPGGCRHGSWVSP